MPRVNLIQTPKRKPGWREYEDRITERYGMFLTTAQLGDVIGVRNYDRIKAWAASEGLQGIPFGKRVKWDSRQVAKAIDNASFRIIQG